MRIHQRRGSLAVLARSLAALFILSIFCAASLGQGQSKKDESQDVVKLGTDLVTVNVQVTGSDGRKLTTLAQKDFSVFEDGVAQEISFFAKVDEPFTLALVLDVSGSTAVQVQMIKKAALHFIDKLKEGDRVSVISFGDEAVIESVASSDRNALKKAIEGIEVLPPNKAGTNLYDALMLMIDNVLKPAKGRKAFVVLTDGVDTNSVNDYEEVLPKVEESGGSSYFIAVDTENYTLSLVMKNRHEPGHVAFTQKQLRKYMTNYVPDEDPSRYLDSDKLSPLEKREVNHGLYEIARQELEEMAAKGAGRVYPIAALSEAASAFGEIAAELRTFYSIGYYPTNIERDGKWRAIRVQVDHPDVKANYRKGYQAPKEPGSP